MTDFDWVTALSQCSIQVAFERLYQGVRQDVETRMMLAGQIPMNLVVTQHRDSFSIVREGRHLGKTMRFTRREKQIEITTDENDLKIIVTLTLNSERECRFVVGGAEIEDWQLRKLALEGLFAGL